MQPLEVFKKRLAAFINFLKAMIFILISDLKKAYIMLVIKSAVERKGAHL